MNEPKKYSAEDNIKSILFVLKDMKALMEQLVLIISAQKERTTKDTSAPTKEMPWG